MDPEYGEAGMSNLICEEVVWVELCSFAAHLSSHLLTVPSFLERKAFAKIASISSVSRLQPPFPPAELFPASHLDAVPPLHDPVLSKPPFWR